jgi:hypothetical protein
VNCSFALLSLCRAEAAAVTWAVTVGRPEWGALSLSLFSFNTNTTPPLCHSLIQHRAPPTMRPSAEAVAEAQSQQQRQRAQQRSVAEHQASGEDRHAANAIRAGAAELIQDLDPSSDSGRIGLLPVATAGYPSASGAAAKPNDLRMDSLSVNSKHESGCDACRVADCV